jgi:hypothetical protein
MLEGYIEDHIMRLLNESGRGLSLREAQTPQGVRYREWLQVERGVRELCHNY